MDRRPPNGGIPDRSGPVVYATHGEDHPKEHRDNREVDRHRSERDRVIEEYNREIYRNRQAMRKQLIYLMIFAGLVAFAKIAFGAEGAGGGGGGGTTITSGAGDFGAGTSQAAGVLTGVVAKVNGFAPTTAAVSHQFATSSDSSGRLTLAQPAFTDISGTVTAAQLGTTINPQFGSLGVGAAADGTTGDITTSTGLLGSVNNVCIMQQKDNGGVYRCLLLIDGSNFLNLGYGSQVIYAVNSIDSAVNANDDLGASGHAFRDGWFTRSIGVGCAADATTGDICASNAVKIGTSQKLNPDGTITPLTVAVASLPTCNAGEKGATANVTDATLASCVFKTTVAGGGGGPALCPVACDGTNWLAF
jgi:hypothetical protein